MSEHDAEQGVLSAPRLDAVCDIVRTLYAAGVNLNRLPAQDPSITTAVTQVVLRFKTLLPDGDVRLGVGHGLLFFNDKPLPETVQNRVYTKAFVNALAARKVHSLNFRADLRPDEVLSFLRVFSLAPGEFTRKQTFADRLRSEGVFNIEALETQPAAVIDAPAPKRRRAEAAAMPSEMSDGAFFGDFIRRLLRSDPFLDGEDAAQFRHRVDFELMSRQASMDFDFVGSLFADAFNEWTGLSKISHVGSRLRPVEPEAAAARIANLAEQVRLTVAAIHQVTNPRWRTRWSEGMVLVLAPLHGRVLAAVFAEDYPADVTFDLVANLMMRLTDEQKHQIVEAYDDEIGRLVKGLRPADFELDIARVKRIADVLGGIKNILPAKEHSPFSAKLQLLIGHVQLLARTEGAVERFLAVKSKRLLAQHPSFFIQKEFLDQFASLVQRFLRAGRARDIRDMMNQAAVNFGAEDWNAKAVTVQAFDRMHREIVKLLHPELLKVGFTILCARVYEGQDESILGTIVGSLDGVVRELARGGDFATMAELLPVIANHANELSPGRPRDLLQGIIERFTNDTTIIARVADAWEPEGDDRNVESLLRFLPREKIFEHVLVLLRDAADMRTRKKCTLLIQKFGTEAVEFVVRELREENFWFYNRNLINLLGEIGDRRAASALVLYLRSPEDKLRRAAISALARVGGETAESALVDAFDTVPPDIQCILAQQYGLRKFASAVPRLVRLIEELPLRDDTMDLVGDAIKALGRIGEEKAAPAVLNFARRVSRRRVFGSAAEGRLVARAIETLAQIGGSSMVHEVETFVVHPDREIGEAARKAVLQLEKKSQWSVAGS